MSLYDTLMDYQRQLNDVRAQLNGIIRVDRAVAGISQICQGRLTLTKGGVPVPISDVVGATSIYFALYNGNQLSLYDGSKWVLHTFAELSLDISALDASSNYDVFVYNNSGTLTLIAANKWTNATTRSVALAYQGGIRVKSGATGYRYLGTIYINSNGGECDDTKAQRFVYNYYNRVLRPGEVRDSTVSWTYNSSTKRIMNGNSDNKFEFIIGVEECPIKANGAIRVNLDTSGLPRTATNSIGLDSTSTAAADGYSGIKSNANLSQAAFTMTNTSEYFGYPGIGYHYLCPLECGTSTITYYGGDYQMFTVEIKG